MVLHQLPDALIVGRSHIMDRSMHVQFDTTPRGPPVIPPSAIREGSMINEACPHALLSQKLVILQNLVVV